MKDAKKRFKRTLFVGLGGAGAKTLRILKKRIVEANNGIQPDQIKFLLIDTNSTELSNFRDFDNNEKICIAVREPYQRYLHDKDTSTHEFIPKQNAHSLLALERGAGQIRSNGHFAVIENQYSNKLMRIFRERADELENIDIKESTLEKDPKIEVRLVFSIAGGTGSGTFLPIATILRAAVKHCELTAYIYSATNFSKKVENSAKYSVMQNAYAALCELDYMMHFGRDESRHKNITFNFGPSENQHMEQSNRPFDEVYYIDKHTNLPDSDSVEFSYNEIDRLQENTADAMHIAATNLITAHTGTVDNVRQKIMEGQFDVSDKFAWVSGLGLAELYFNEISENDSFLIDTCLDSINGRIDKGKALEELTITNIVQKFVDQRYDESKGSDDHDPILSKFISEKELHEFSVKKVKQKGSNNAKSDDFEVKFKDVVFQEKRNDVTKIEEELKKEFEDDLNGLIKKLIDEDKDSADVYVKGYDGKGFGLSLEQIKKIISAIKLNSDTSVTTLKEEQEKHRKEQKSADEEIKTESKKGVSSPVPIQRKKYLGFIPSPKIKPNGPQPNGNNTGQSTNTGSLDVIHEAQTRALENRLLAERDQEAIDVLKALSVISNKKIEEIDKWISILEKASSVGSKEKGKIDLPEKTKKKVNRVEVYGADINKAFRIKYSHLTELASKQKTGNLGTDESFFNAIKIYIIKANGSLHEYLVNGIDEIKAQAESGETKTERTECQQKIDRLIDLSSPTMQVDRHGYGERVKVDHFWYVMTDCPEANVADKSKDGADKSVGALLKELIEQNTLEAKVNLVHVPEWKNKAMVYRVDSAVPVYFVDGVCESTEGGYTLEGCYEELKKTKLTYTPFSHETLRKLLENRKCALKPMDSVEDSKVLDYWLNFIMLQRIVIRGNDDERYYCIDSERCGERISNRLECRNRVLLLGKTRAEAYNTFQRYCGELIKEWKSYEEDIKKPFFPQTAQEDKKRNVYQIFSCDYINDKQLCQYNGDISKLTKDDDDFIMLDREMTRIDKRAIEYADKVKEKYMNEKLSNCDRKDFSEYCNKLMTLSNQD